MPSVLYKRPEIYMTTHYIACSQSTTFDDVQYSKHHIVCQRKSSFVTKGVTQEGWDGRLCNMKEKYMIITNVGWETWTEKDYLWDQNTDRRVLKYLLRTQVPRCWQIQMSQKGSINNSLFWKWRNCLSFIEINFLNTWMIINRPSQTMKCESSQLTNLMSCTCLWILSGCGNDSRCTLDTVATSTTILLYVSCMVSPSSTGVSWNL